MVHYCFKVVPLHVVFFDKYLHCYFRIESLSFYGLEQVIVFPNLYSRVKECNTRRTHGNTITKFTGNMPS